MKLKNLMLENTKNIKKKTFIKIFARIVKMLKVGKKQLARPKRFKKLKRRNKVSKRYLKKIQIFRTSFWSRRKIIKSGKSIEIDRWKLLSFFIKIQVKYTRRTWRSKKYFLRKLWRAKSKHYTFLNRKRRKWRIMIPKSYWTHFAAFSKPCRVIARVNPWTQDQITLYYKRKKERKKNKNKNKFYFKKQYINHKEQKKKKNNNKFKKQYTFYKEFKKNKFKIKKNSSGYVKRPKAKIYHAIGWHNPMSRYAQCFRNQKNLFKKLTVWENKNVKLWSQKYKRKLKYWRKTWMFDVSPHYVIKNHMKRRYKHTLKPLIKWKNYWLSLILQKKTLYKKLKYKPLTSLWAPNFWRKNQTYFLFNKLIYNEYKQYLRRRRGGFGRIKQILGRIVLPFYGHLLYKQFSKINQHSLRQRHGVAPRHSNFFSNLECRLDVLIYRLNLAPTIMWARFFIDMGFVYISNSNFNTDHAVKPFQISLDKPHLKNKMNVNLLNGCDSCLAGDKNMFPIGMETLVQKLVDFKSPKIKEEDNNSNIELGHLSNKYKYWYKPWRFEKLVVKYEKKYKKIHKDWNKNTSRKYINRNEKKNLIKTDKVERMPIIEINPLLYDYPQRDFNYLVKPGEIIHWNKAMKRFVFLNFYRYYFHKPKPKYIMYNRNRTTALLWRYPEITDLQKSDRIKPEYLNWIA